LRERPIRDAIAAERTTPVKATCTHRTRTTKAAGTHPTPAEAARPHAATATTTATTAASVRCVDHDHARNCCCYDSNANVLECEH
jgi:hypothetical protein